MTLPTGLNYHSQQLAVNGNHVHFVNTPTGGSPTLFIHGLGANWTVWQGITRRLRPALNPYYVDLRGHGDSHKPAAAYTAAYTIEDYASDIVGLLRHLGPLAIVGSSLGGLVGIVAAATAPDCVTRLVLVDPPLGPAAPDRADFFIELKRRKQMAPATLADHLAEFFPKSTDLQRQALAKLWLQVADGVLDAAIAGEPSAARVWPYLSRVQCPTLLMRADVAEGGVLAAVDAERALAELRFGQLHFFPGAGHAIHATAAAEFAAALLAFLAPTG